MVTWSLGRLKKKATKSKNKSDETQDDMEKNPTRVNKKSSDMTKEQFPKLLNEPLAPTPPEEKAEKVKSKEAAGERQYKRKKLEGSDKGHHLLLHRDVKPPTVSQRRRREAELEKETEGKIASGFYQSRSDKNDTLENVGSLTEELTEQSHR